MRDYKLHMQMVGFLHDLYPTRAYLSHAGELNTSLVHRWFASHIRDAVIAAHAERIGHGVDIAYEDNTEQLLRTWRKIT